MAEGVNAVSIGDVVGMVRDGLVLIGGAVAVAALACGVCWFAV